MKKAITITVALLLLLGAAMVPGMDGAGSAGPAQADATAGDSVDAALMNLPLYFIENQGQIDQRVAYYVQGRDMGLYFTAQGVTFAMSGPAEEDGSQEHYALKLEFVGADPNVQPVGKDLTEAVISYFTGSPDEWKTGLPAYASVLYPDLWPGIDLVYSGDTSRLKYTFMVQPGADPGQIGLAYSGASSVILNEGRQLEVRTPLGSFIDDRPVAYQDVGGQRLPVQSSYSLDEDTHSYGFQVGSYDAGELLVIDPVVLVYCGYIGGDYGDPKSGTYGHDRGWGIAVDGSGCAYVTGETSSTNITFPIFVGPYLTHSDYQDAFVAKVSANGTGLDYCGYIGGSGADYGYGIAVDGSGCAYVTGETGSNVSEGFPVSVGPDTDYNGSGDAFVAKVTANGSMLDYCGYIGGNESDKGRGIAVDGSSRAYITGFTYSDNTTFPDGGGFGTLTGPDTSYNDNGIYGDAFVAKVKDDGTGLDYCGYIGGNVSDYGHGIAVEGSGCAYVTGFTYSDNTTFPDGAGFDSLTGPDTSYNGKRDAFVAKVTANGSMLDYCGYIGGNESDWGYGIAVDGSGYAYVTGETQSNETSFPDGGGFGSLTGPDTSYNGDKDAFVAKVNAGGNGLDYCGYIGGSERDRGQGIAVAGDGCAYVTGETGSNVSEGFPVFGGPDTEYNGDEDAFVAKVNAGGSGLDYCGYIGGSDRDSGKGIAVDGSGCAYVTGYTGSNESSFPDGDGFGTLTGPYTSFSSDPDAFVAKVCETDPELIVPVGGVIEPVERLQVLAPWLGLAAFIVLSISVIVIMQRKRAT